MLLYLLLLFTVAPLVELSLLIALHDRVGLLNTLLLVLFTGVLGAHLARRQGIEAYWRLQKSLRAGAMPTDALFDGALILVAGALLVTPGVLTDAFGFGLLIPPFREGAKWLLRRQFKRMRLAGVVTVVGSQPRQEPPSGATPEPGSTTPEEARIIDVQVDEVRTKPDP